MFYHVSTIFLTDCNALDQSDVDDSTHIELLCLFGLFPDTYLWYMFPAGANRVYGYDSTTNQSFESDELSPGTKVAVKDNTHGMHIPKANELILGDFANPCLENSTVCSSFSISFLVYITGSVSVSENVHVLNSSSPGPYHVQFLVTRSSARLEGHASVVGGNSSKILHRKVEFPAADIWVHVTIVYSSQVSLVLYINSMMVTSSDAVLLTDWQTGSSDRAVQVSLGSRQNSHDIFVSYFQIIKGSLSKEEVGQLEKESRQQGKLRGK